MRRILLSLMAVGSAAVLAACSQGGTAFNTNTNMADRVVVTANGNGGSTGTAKVLPGFPITLSAVAVNSPNNAVNTTAQFTWTVTPQVGGTFTNGATGAQTLCPTTYGTPASPLVPVSALTAGVFTNGTTTNSSNNLTVVPPAAGTLFTPAGGPAISPATPYCLVATAKFTPSGAQGSIVIYVSPNP